MAKFMNTRNCILICLLMTCSVFSFAHKAKIGRFEVIPGTRMSIYAYGSNANQWDYIYIDSPWAAPFFVEERDIASFIQYTQKAIDAYKQWTQEVETIGNVSMYHKHIDFNKTIFIHHYDGYDNYSIERKHKESAIRTLSYDFFVAKDGAAVLLECNITTSYNQLSFYLDAEGADDFIYVLRHATERYLSNPNVKAENALDKLLH